MSDEATSRKLRVRRVALDDLVLDESNPRRHGAVDLAAVEASLRAHGQVEPLVVQRGTMRVVAGNGRAQAMRSLGMDRADVVEVECDDTEFRALSIRLNRTGELAGWDSVALAAALDELAGAGIDTLDLGFDEAALAGLAGPGAPSSDEWAAAAAGLPDADRAPFQQLSFTLHDDQAATVRRALDVARVGACTDQDQNKNTNGNGNALARVCERFLAHAGDGDTGG